MPGVVSASELAAYVYCPEQWRLEHGLGLEPANRAEMNAGTQHHERKAGAEQVAGKLITLGSLLAVLAVVALLLVLWWWS